MAKAGGSKWYPAFASNSKVAAYLSDVDKWVSFCDSLEGAASKALAALDGEGGAKGFQVSATCSCLLLVLALKLIMLSDLTQAAKDGLIAALGKLEASLAKSTYLCGDALTLADVVCACSLVDVFKKLLDPTLRAGLPATTRWFTTCVGQPSMSSLGNVALCAKPEAQKSSGGDKKVSRASLLCRT